MGSDGCSKPQSRPRGNGGDSSHLPLANRTEKARRRCARLLLGMDHRPIKLDTMIRRIGIPNIRQRPISKSYLSAFGAFGYFVDMG
jgi:hypothetical protein